MQRGLAELLDGESLGGGGRAALTLRGLENEVGREGSRTRLSDLRMLRKGWRRRCKRAKAGRRASCIDQLAETRRGEGRLSHEKGSGTENTQ